MKLLFVFLMFCLFSLDLSSQSFEGIIKFTHHVTFKEGEKGFPHHDKNIVYNTEYQSYKSVCFIKQDSILIEKYYHKLLEPDFYIYQKDSIPLLINNSIGNVSKYKFYGRFRVPEFKKKKKVKIILGYECNLYKSENDKVKIELWVANKLKVDKNKEAFEKYNYDGFLILEQLYYAKLTKTLKHTLATEIALKKPKNIYPKIIEIKKKDRSEEFYAPISQNTLYDKIPIKVGDTLANLFYRDLNSFKILPFNRFKNNGKFLLIEFWGTWCAPCLRITPQIKELYDKNNAKVDILSLNVLDSRYDRIKFIIKKEEMTWQHGFSTEKIISILNSRKAYPTMVLLNDKMEVLLKGNPAGQLEKAQKIINSFNY